MNNRVDNHFNQQLEQQVGSALMQQLKENQRWFFWLGIMFIIIGTLAIMFSSISTEIFVIYFGAFLIMLGFLEGAKAFNMRLWQGFFALHLLTGFLFALAGIFMLLNPLENAIILTFFWSVFFIISGIVRILIALTKHMPHNGLVVVSGLMNIVLGALVFWQWPISGTWVIGLFVGIDVLITGWSLVMISSMVKQIQ